MSALLLTLLIFVQSALAARVEMAVDSRDLTVGQTVNLQIQVIDGDPRGLPDVVTQPGLNLRYQGQSQSRMMVNFETTRIVRYTYAMSAQQPGTWQVGPVTVDVDGRKLRAAPITVQVRPRQDAAESTTQVSGRISDETPYVGQVVVYTFRFQTRDRIYDARWTPPELNGFRDEGIAESSQREFAYEQDGHDWTVQEVYVPLVATSAGAQTISPAVLTVQVPATRSRRRRSNPFGMSDVSQLTLSTEPTPAAISALPTVGRPADFSGLVGQFTLTAHLSERNLKVGDSATLEISLTGDGTLAGFTLPTLPDGEGMRAYDDAPELRAGLKDGRFKSAAVFRRAIVPERSGELTIPPISLTVFDPGEGAYKTLTTRPIRLNVSPGEKAGELASFGDGPVASGRAVESVGDDILPAPGDASVGDRTLSAALPTAIALPLVSSLALLGLAMRSRVHHHTVPARQALNDRLATLPTDPEARLAALEDIFRDAAAQALGREAPGLDHAAVATLGEDAAKLYADLEAARYGGAAVDDDLLGRVTTFVGAHT